MSCHLSLLKNISKNLRSMSHHLMPHHLSPLKNNSKNQENHLLPHHLSIENNCKNSKKITWCHITFLYWKLILKIQGAWHITSSRVTFLYWKIIQKNSRKMYYNSLRVIDGEFSQHASMSGHLSPLKIILKTLEKYIFPN
jgi:hypothetical protein